MASNGDNDDDDDDDDDDEFDLSSKSVFANSKCWFELCTIPKKLIEIFFWYEDATNPEWSTFSF